jgi:hypothetical protein
MRALTTAAIAMMLLAPGRNAGMLHAQSASAVAAPGSRVRVTAPASVSFVGTLVAVPDDSVRVLAENGANVTLPAAHLTLERSTGLRSNRKRGAGIGFLSGALLGGLIGSATYSPSPCNGNVNERYCPEGEGVSRKTAVPLAAAVGGAAGAFAGALLGHSPRESWQRVPLSTGPSRVGLSERGIGLRIAM